MSPANQSIHPPPATPARRPAQPPRVQELADFDAFGLWVGRHAISCKRDRTEMSVLSIQAHPEQWADTTPEPGWLLDCTRRLASRVRPADHVARWKHTHFGIVLLRCPPEHAPAVLRRLLHAANAPYGTDQQLLHVTVLGEVLQTPE